jgi:hypothetical protein
LVVIVVTLLAYGCPVQAIVMAFGLDERTVMNWQSRSGQHCQQVHEHLVERPRDLGQVQADEIRVKMQGLIVWMAMAIQVPTRLWQSENNNTRWVELERRFSLDERENE